MFPFRIAVPFVLLVRVEAPCPALLIVAPTVPKVMLYPSRPPSVKNLFATPKVKAFIATVFANPLPPSARSRKTVPGPETRVSPLLAKLGSVAASARTSRMPLFNSTFWPERFIPRARPSDTRTVVLASTRTEERKVLEVFWSQRVDCSRFATLTSLLVADSKLLMAPAAIRFPLPVRIACWPVPRLRAPASVVLP